MIIDGLNRIKRLLCVVLLFIAATSCDMYRSGLLNHSNTVTTDSFEGRIEAYAYYCSFAKGHTLHLECSGTFLFNPAGIKINLKEAKRFRNLQIYVDGRKVSDKESRYVQDGKVEITLDLNGFYGLFPIKKTYAPYEIDLTQAFWDGDNPVFKEPLLVTYE